MTDRPIPFTDPMVAALLAGTKTQTRRYLGLKGHRAFTEFGPSDTPGYDWHFRDAGMRWHDLRDHELKVRLPWQVGDRLWVREAYFQYGEWRQDVGKQTAGGKPKWAFLPERDDVRFDEPPEGFYLGRSALNQGRLGWYKRLGRFMPRAASRMTLLVTGVRVQRLQDISEEDAVAEGIERLAVADLPDSEISDADDLPEEIAEFRQATEFLYRNPLPSLPPALRLAHFPKLIYRQIWESINGPGSWDANPWVVALTFTVERQNICERIAP